MPFQPQAYCGDKENLRPLSGVNSSTSSEIRKNVVSKPDPLAKSASSQFELDCKQWERKLAEASENDPLTVWDGYIRWAQQNSSQNPTHMSSLLSRCTRQFQSDDRYKSDPRYLRIWIKYIDTADKPIDIFTHLERSGIGCDLALFYTSWSLVLELKNAAYPEAYSKLEQGVKRRARPVEQWEHWEQLQMD